MKKVEIVKNEKTYKRDILSLYADVKNILDRSDEGHKKNLKVPENPIQGLVSIKQQLASL